MKKEEKTIGQEFENFLEHAVSDSKSLKEEKRFVSKQDIRDEIKRCNISEEEYRKYLKDKGSFTKKQIDMEIERLYRPTQRDLEVERSELYQKHLKLRFYE